jgi:hypothetical protein
VAAIGESSWSLLLVVLVLMLMLMLMLLMRSMLVMLRGPGHGP